MGAVTPFVLFLDDEAEILESFKRFLRKESYQSLYTSSISEALDLVKANKPHLIITDYRMGSITGLQFVEQARQTHPHAIYVIYSGFADEKPIQDALASKMIDRFINKPWEVRSIKAEIAALLELYRKLYSSAEPNGESAA